MGLFRTRPEFSPGTISSSRRAVPLAQGEDRRGKSHARDLGGGGASFGCVSLTPRRHESRRQDSNLHLLIAVR